jgi:hypothetical protein
VVVEVVAVGRRRVVTVGAGRPVVDVAARATTAAAVPWVTVVVVVLLVGPSPVPGALVAAASADGRDVGRPPAPLEQPPPASAMTSVVASTAAWGRTV